MVATTGKVDGRHPQRETQFSESRGEPLPNPIPTFGRLLAESAQKYADNIALVSMHQESNHIPIDFPDNIRSNAANDTSAHIRWTHRQLQYGAEVLASGLEAHGVRKGQPIATFLFNCAEWALLIRAAAILGCPFVPLGSRSVANANEVQHMLKTSKAKVLVVANAQMASKLDQSLPELVRGMKLRIVLEKDVSAAPPGWHGFDDIVRGFGQATKGNEVHARVNSNGMLSHTNGDGTQTVKTGVVHRSSNEGQDVALMVFTSGKTPRGRPSCPEPKVLQAVHGCGPILIVVDLGTTSFPKGAIYSSTTISASLISSSMALKTSESSRTCCHMPNNHIGGINMALSCMIVGGSAVFPSPAFDPAASLEAVSREQCTNLPSVPAMIQAFANHEKVKSVDLSSLRNVETGATTILLEHLKQVRTVLGCHSLSNSFSATEMTPVTVGFHDTAAAETVTVGTACPGVSIRICDPGSREPVPRGYPGEIHVSGPMAINGYLEGTSSDSFYHDKHGEWYITGDQGIMAEDGTVTISGRYKDLIIRGGENIAPAAIEAVLDAKLGVTAQVVGVRSEVAGEVPVAVIQPKKGIETPPLAEIRKILIKEMGPASVPERFLTLEDLGLKDYPRTSSGKVRKVELKEILKSQNKSQENEDDTYAGGDTHDRLARLWQKIIGIDIQMLEPDSHIEDFADSLTVMRLRNLIKRDMGLEISTEALVDAGTIKEQAALLSSMQNAHVGDALFRETQREGPPGVDDMAITLGSPAVAAEIQRQVTQTIAPYGFTWQDDVEDVLPSWDLGYELFGSVAGSGKVNHRVSLSTKKTSVEQLHAALRTAIKRHAMHRSFELRGLNGEPTMRVIMRPNDRWFQYAIGDVAAVEKPDDLTDLLYDGVHFAKVEHPYPSFQVRIAPIKSTGTAGLMWALQHSAFDGLALHSFLEDVDAALVSSSIPQIPHVPYKLWADIYYLHRSSLAASRSVSRQTRRLSTLSSHESSLFPPPPTDGALALPPTDAAQRRTFIAPVRLVPLPHLVALRRAHGISPFLVIKAALALFLARKTRTGVAVFGQVDNGRSWPFVEPWMQRMLPDCMDLAGPTLERTVQIITIPSLSSSPTDVLSFLRAVKNQHEIEAQDVHAPWNLVRGGLHGGDKDRALFDAAAMGTCLNYLPMRTQDGRIVFDELVYHETKSNSETAWLFNCGIEGDGEATRMWTQILADEDIVSRESSEGWTREVMDLVVWLTDQQNWNADLNDCRIAVDA